jgi:hypothetical protein
MKLIIVFLLLSPTLFAQNKDRNAIQNQVSLNSLIIGDWFLDQIEIVDGYNFYLDSSKFTSQQNSNKKITITSDSIYNHRDTTLPYYVGNRNFSYKIQYDSIVRSNYLKLYEGKARKLREVESFRIVKCSIDELILISYQFINNGLDYTSISIVNTYRKDGITDFLSELKGDWFYCSNQSISFMTENDSLTYEFKPKTNDLACQKSDTHIDLEFKRENYENMVEFSFSYDYGGVFGTSIFNIDPKHNLIYFMGTNKSYIYNYKVVNNEKLFLSLDLERTQKINTH